VERDEGADLGAPPPHQGGNRRVSCRHIERPLSREAGQRPYGTALPGPRCGQTQTLSEERSIHCSALSTAAATFFLTWRNFTGSASVA
jgi:hypothetical protein